MRFASLRTHSSPPPVRPARSRPATRPQPSGLPALFGARGGAALALACALGAVGGALGAASPARACDPAVPCRPATLLPGDGETIPANASELVLLAGDSWPVDTHAVRLLGPDGADVPVSVEEALFLGPGVYRIRLLAPLRAGGRYQLLGPRGCGGPPSSSTFQVGPFAPRPTSVGTLVRESLAYDRRTSPCDTEARTFTVARYRHVAPPDLQPWLPLAYGEVFLDGVVEPGGPRALAGRTFEVAASCDGGQATDRAVELELTVAGELRGATPTVTAPLACDAFVGCSAGGAVRRRAAPAGASAVAGAGISTALLGLGLLGRLLRARRSSPRRS
jgi:hypothetical protein